ncbi:MAG: 30S ribosomal protein S1 [Gemmatimonadota bacterium]|nr:30S ribosomal protein S1 [Gemmatimonadota bacterium]
MSEENNTASQPVSQPSTAEALEALDEREYSEEEFASMMSLYEDTMSNITEGEIVSGTVLAVAENSVVVDIGFKSEGAIPLAEFADPSEVEVGQEIEVYLEDVEDQEGQIVLSKQKADFMRVWDRIKDAYDSDQIVEGRLVRRIKGGIVVDLFGVDAFLPGSQIDIKQVKNFDQFIGEVFPFRIIKLNKNRRNIVVSRRVVLEAERERLRKQILQTLEVGQIREGAVKNITDFGAFIDLGGLDGLLHITDISWGRIGHPSEVLSIGDNVQVKVLNYDEERERISLGMKQLMPHPWENIEDKYPVGDRVDGKVVSITDYGAFVELEQGVEGLVHISEMSWTQHIRHPSKLVSIGDQLKVVILNVDKDGQKISLGMKQTTDDPWLSLDEKYPVGTRLTGLVRNLVNFGAFVEIEEGIDGLVHISDMSWTRRVRHPSDVVKKGEQIDVVVLNIDKKRRRISLGHKQTIENPWPELAVQYAVGKTTEGRISRLLERGVVVDMDGDVEGFIPVSQLGLSDLQTPQTHFSEHDKLPLKVVEFDEEQRKIVLSVKEYMRDAEQAEIDAYIESHRPKPVTVGDVVGDVADSEAGSGDADSDSNARAGAESPAEGEDAESNGDVASVPQPEASAEGSAEETDAESTGGVSGEDGPPAEETSGSGDETEASSKSEA